MDTKVSPHGRLIGLMLLLGLHGISSFAAGAEDLIPLESESYPNDLLPQIRRTATTVPGELAVSINFV
ncbi:MAG: hypothetical protein O6700_03335, partial [Gammaproteobacteria bacterium]|nr:hypothetical protein [Gammaproteobacteria bacterium]